MDSNKYESLLEYMLYKLMIMCGHELLFVII
jgi:hypothetical protein